jgi:hypothetical protein
MLIVYWWESQKERDHWEDQDLGGWTISKWIELIGIRIGTGRGLFEYGIEPSGSIKCWEVVECLPN